jgi:hypothetical protein
MANTKRTPSDILNEAYANSSGTEIPQLDFSWINEKEPKKQKKMKAEKPAEGILLRKDWGDAKSYTVPCECCGSDCEHNIWVESDETGITVTTYTKQKTKWWELNRWQIIWRLLTKGYVEYEASIIMREQQALNYAETLKNAIIDVEKFQAERLKK